MIVTYVIPVQHIECIMIELFGARFVGRVFRGRERRNRMFLQTVVEGVKKNTLGWINDSSKKLLAAAKIEESDEKCE